MDTFKVLWQIVLFRRLLLARVISNLGNGMAPIAMSFGVLDLPQGTPTSLSAVLTAHAVAVVLTLPLGGVLADRVPRTYVIAITDMVLASVVVCIGVLFLTGSVTVPALIALNFVAGALNGLWYPAFPGLTPDVVRGQHLQAANATVTLGANSAIILGTAVGGIIVSTLGSGLAFVLDGLTFFVAGALIWSLRHVSTAKPSGESLLRDLRDGWASFVSMRWIWIVVSGFAVIVAMFQAANGVLGPVLMKDDYNGASSWSLVLGAEAAGFIVGALAAARWRPQRPLLVGVLWNVTAAVWMLSMALSSPLWVIMVAIFFWGFAMDLFGVMWITQLQKHVSREVFSRVTSYDAMGSLILGPVGIAIAGPAVGWFGVSTSLTIAAAVTAAIVLLLAMDPAVRAMRNDTPGHPDSVAEFARQQA